MNVTPMRDCLFVLPDKNPEKIKGIILPGYSQKKYAPHGVIVAIGPKVQNFEIGTKVLFGEFSGAKHIMEYQGEDTDIYIMTEDDILAILN